MFLLNGIPWWWPHGRRGESGPLKLLDPESTLWTQVKPERALGCVVHSPNEMVEPGIVVHTGQNHLILGEPDGSSTDRLKAAVAMFERGGIEAHISADVRRELLEKLVLNASGNTLAALARADQGALGADAELAGLSVRVMREVLDVARTLGYDLGAKLDLETLARRGRPGQRPSMLQDVLQGRRIEVEALLGQVQAFARDARVAVPTIDVIIPLLRGLDRSLKISPPQ